MSAACADDRYLKFRTRHARSTFAINPTSLDLLLVGLAAVDRPHRDPLQEEGHILLIFSLKANTHATNTCAT